MSEKFFIVTKKSKLYDDYFQYRRNQKQLRKIMRDFTKKYHLPNLAAADGDTYSIIADKNTPFKSQLKKHPTWTKRGKLYDFKKSSFIGKAWRETLNTAGFKFIHRPLILLYFSNIQGKCSWETFKDNEKLYLKIETEFEQNTPNGMNEIKGSEYYKAIEEYNARKGIQQ